MLLDILDVSLPVKAIVAKSEGLEGHVYREAFSANANNVVHAEVAQLIQHQRVIVAVGSLVLVGLDAPYVPRGGGCKGAGIDSVQTLLPNETINADYVIQKRSCM